MQPVIAPSTALAAKLFRGLGDEVRLKVLIRLAEGEKCVSDLVEQVASSQSNVSGHLACLRDCGLVATRSKGRHVLYRLAGVEVVHVLTAAEKLLATNGHQIDLCSNYRQADDG